MQRALTKRNERFMDSTKEIYGALCGGGKLTFFLMKHDRNAGNFPCYFIANSADNLQTTTLELDNIGDILAMNIIIMLGGDYQSADQPRAGQEKLKSTITPAKIDSSNVLSVKQLRRAKAAAKELHVG